MTRRAVITGLGIVSPIGIGGEMPFDRLLAVDAVGRCDPVDPKPQSRIVDRRSVPADMVALPGFQR